MSLREEIQTLLDKPTASAERGCNVCRVIEQLQQQGRGEDLGSIRAALSSKIGAEPLARIFRKNGLEAGKPSILAHRREGHKA